MPRVEKVEQNCRKQMDCSDDDDTEAGRPSTPLSFVHGSPILKLGRQSRASQRDAIELLGTYHNPSNLRVLRSCLSIETDGFNNVRSCPGSTVFSVTTMSVTLLIVHIVWRPEDPG